MGSTVPNADEFVFKEPTASLIGDPELQPLSYARSVRNTLLPDMRHVSELWFPDLVLYLDVRGRMERWLHTYEMDTEHFANPNASFLFVGDLNGHHPEWLGSTTTNSHGVAAFDFATVSG